MATTAPRRPPRSARVTRCAGRRAKPPHRGAACPRCRQGRLDYDGLAQLSCRRCGYVADSGGFT